MRSLIFRLTEHNKTPVHALLRQQELLARKYGRAVSPLRGGKPEQSKCGVYRLKRDPVDSGRPALARG
jgi:hypothetical protein